MNNTEPDFMDFLGKALILIILMFTIIFALGHIIFDIVEFSWWWKLLLFDVFLFVMDTLKYYINKK